MRFAISLFYLFVAAVVLLVRGPTIADAAPVCSGSTACAGMNNVIELNYVRYCCPATDVAPSFTSPQDASTYSCPTVQTCRQYNCCEQLNTS